MLWILYFCESFVPKYAVMTYMEGETMTFALEPAAAFAQPLNHLIIKATFDPANEWFFFDGAHSGANVLEQGMSNTWLHEYFAREGF
jgi:hypothetical protein